MVPRAPGNVVAMLALKPDEPAYWFGMQIGMIVGFLTSYPMNWWLIKVGIKDPM